MSKAKQIMPRSVDVACNDDESMGPMYSYSLRLEGKNRASGTRSPHAEDKTLETVDEFRPVNSNFFKLYKYSSVFNLSELIHFKQFNTWITLNIC